MEFSAASPKPTSRPNFTLNFFSALREIMEGKKIHKLEWKDRGYYGVMANEQLTLHKPTGTLHPWIVSYGDMAGEDYVILEG